MGAPNKRVLPLPVVTQLVNATPFPDASFMKLAASGEFHDVVLLSASCRLDGAQWQLMSTHRAAIAGDEYWNEADALASSLKRPGDYVVFKPATDVYVTGAAYAPDQAPRAEWGVALRVGANATGVGQQLERIHFTKLLHVTGPRYWKQGALGWSLSKPEAAARVPLSYEFAYGGWWRDPHNADADEALHQHGSNPSGSGVMAPSWAADAAAQGNTPQPPRYAPGGPIAGPQIGFPGDTLDTANTNQKPAGLGPIARHWEPRVKWAGTYSAKHLADGVKRGYSSYPPNFDPRYFQDAPTDQQISPYLRGDEWIDLIGLLKSGQSVRTRLPGFAIRVKLRDVDNVEHDAAMPLDTVHIDTDPAKGSGSGEPVELHMSWRISIPHSRKIKHVTLWRESLSDAPLQPAPGYTQIPSAAQPSAAERLKAWQQWRTEAERDGSYPQKRDEVRL